jgi:hypothetical protein
MGCQKGDTAMINAIGLLRKTGDQCERRAKAATDRAVAAELADMTAHWHWLAGEAAKLLKRADELEPNQRTQNLTQELEVC